MNIHFVMHEEFEAPGAIEIWADINRLKKTYTRLYKYDKFPDQIDHLDLIVIMGGPQSPDSSKVEYPYFDAAKEMEWLKKLIDQDKAVLGICLGAQLIGGALGARFEHSPQREIGVFEISLTEAGRKDPFFSRLQDEFTVGHWHGDMPGLTEESEVLAYSDGCPRQIVRYTPKIYGFQCHMEFTKESIKGMIANCKDDLKYHDKQPFVESPEELRRHDFDQMNQYLFDFLDYLMCLYT